MKRDEVAAIQVRALTHWLRWLGAASPGAFVVEQEGVTASVVPALPERSIANGVAFASAADLEHAYDEVAAAYESAGVAAWTVWTPEFDDQTAELLSKHGHELDGTPTAMVADLDTFEPPDLGDLVWDHEITPAELGELNDRAYKIEGENGIAAAFGPPPEGFEVHWYRALVDGEAACGLTFADAGDDTGVYFVATPPEFQGRGLSTRLMAVAMAEARARGQTTSSLQASAMGEPIYAKLGYRPYFSLRMYERR